MESDSSKNGKNSKQALKKKSNFKKLLHLIRNLFCKKTKKSFFSVMSHLLEAYEKEGLISFEEKKMFKNIASFGDKRVSNVMTPRADLIAVRQDARPKRAAYPAFFQEATGSLKSGGR